MPFPTNIYLISFVGALSLATLSLPVWRRVCWHWEIVDDPGQRKIHHQPMPLAGGLAVLTALLVPLTLAMLAEARTFLGDDGAAKLHHGFSVRFAQLAVILAGAMGMTTLGLLDDRFELRPASKFAGQFLVALAVALAGVRITLFVPSVVFSYALTVLWILTLTNAFNFMDNMNGLCAGLGVIGAALFGIAAARTDDYLVASFAFLVSGSLSGFLPWNYPRARAFLGDSGSHLTGYLLAVLAILPHFYSAKHPHRLAVFSPLLILAVPLADLLWVVVLRAKAGRPFYLGDTNHLSHRLVRRGLSPVRAVALIWAVAAALGAMSLLLS